MNLLALETSTERLSLAVLCGERVFAREIDAGQRHSELTIPLMHQLLAEAALPLSAIEAIAFGQGPGSFTGVRIACGLAQGLALGLGVGVVPVETQMALAEQAGGERVLVAVDARMNEIYFAAYERDIAVADGSAWRHAVAPRLVAPIDLPPLAAQDWRGAGSAFAVPALAEALADRYGAGLATGAAVLPRARDVAAIAARRIAAHGAAALIEPAAAAPLYLRNKVAMTIAERRAHHAGKASVLDGVTRADNTGAADKAAA